MATQILGKPQVAPLLHEVPTIPPQEGRVYASAFDTDIESLKLNDGDPSNNACTEIRRVSPRHGFTWQQGSVHFGGDNVNAVTCALAAIDVARILPWFAASVPDIRMLRSEEINDLMPADQQAEPDA